MNKRMTSNEDRTHYAIKRGTRITYQLVPHINTPLIYEVLDSFCFFYKATSMVNTVSI